jgi:hypothetical protein
VNTYEYNKTSTTERMVVSFADCNIPFTNQAIKPTVATEAMM